MDKDSEYGSEAEDIEFRLYQQLYFEANPNGTEADSDRRLSTEEQHERKTDPKTHDEQVAQLDGFQLKHIHDQKHLPKMKSSTPPHEFSRTASKIDEAQNSQFDKCIYISTDEGAEVTLTDFTANVNARNTETCSIAQEGKINGNCGPEDSCSDDVSLIKKNMMSLQSVRKRLSSTCSDGSIPGSVPLDVLYCDLVTSEEEGDDTMENRLIMKNIETKDLEKTKEKPKAVSNKRKRGKASCSDEEEDSRCNNLISTTSQSTVNEGDAHQLEGDTDSDDDIHVLPPQKAKKPEIFTLESSSDSEKITCTRNGTFVKSNRNKFRKIEKPPPSALTTKNKEGKSKSVHQVSCIRGEQKRKERDSAAAGSESDSCDVDMPEATKGTDLTLNIDKKLSDWVKTITKDAPANKRKKDTTTKSHNKRNCSSVDFTRGRPDTTTRPSCEKWTQSMANFYDSDVSDDFDVSEIHLQQSSKSDIT